MVRSEIDSCFKNILNLLEFQRALPRRDVSLEFVAIVGAIFYT